MENLETRGLLQAARTAGFQIELEGNQLSVTGPRDRKDILDELRAHKAAIIEEMRCPGDVRDRMLKGIALLTEQHNALLLDPANKQLEESFSINMDTWITLAESLKDYDKCPIGGCDDKAPVSCMHCAEPATQQAGA